MKGLTRKQAAAAATTAPDWWAIMEADNAAWDALLRRRRVAQRRCSPLAQPGRCVRREVRKRIDAAIPEELQLDYEHEIGWQISELSLWADTGFQLGLAVGRRGARLKIRLTTAVKDHQAAVDAPVKWDRAKVMREIQREWTTRRRREQRKDGA